MTNSTITDGKLTIDLSTLRNFNDIQQIAKSIMGPIVESMLEAEMDHHLGYGKHSKAGYGTGNSRNGKYSKTIRTSQGDMKIEVPRDRNGNFEPEVVPKHTSNVGDLDVRIINMMQQGMTSGEICEHLHDVYGATANKDMITAVSDKLIPEIKAWQNKPLDSFYV